MIEKTRNGIGMTSARTRERLIERLKAEGVRDVAVLERIRSVPRHLFVDEALASRAYEDTPLPIGFSQTISQPLVVALMTEALIAGCEGKKITRVLEIGTGSGYQTAVLAPFVQHIYSVERIEPLVQRARMRLAELKIGNVSVRMATAGSAGRARRRSRAFSSRPPPEDSARARRAARRRWPTDHPDRRAARRARSDAEAPARDAAWSADRARGAATGELRANGRGDGALTCTARAALPPSQRSRRRGSALCSVAGARARLQRLHERAAVRAARARRARGRHAVLDCLG